MLLPPPPLPLPVAGELALRECARAEFEGDVADAAATAADAADPLLVSSERGAGDKCDTCETFALKRGVALAVAVPAMRAGSGACAGARSGAAGDKGLRAGKAMST